MCTGIISNKKLLLSYIILLAAAMAMIADIMPHSDTFAAKQTVAGSNHSLPVCYLFSWLLIPSENLFTSFSSELLYMREEVNPIGEVIAAGAISLLIWAVLFVICRKRRMVAELFIPYSFIAVLTALHISPHHFGIFFMYMLFKQLLPPSSTAAWTMPPGARPSLITFPVWGARGCAKSSPR